MLCSIRFEDGQIKLDGYPKGSSLRGIKSSEAQELCRLFIFRSDLNYVVGWLKAVEAEKLMPEIREALCTAALVRFCSCFEGTSGLRTKPLKRKRVFSGNDRKVLERLRQIRNKLVAHNEHLYPGEYPLIALDSDATAIEVVVLQLNVPFSAMSDVSDLRRLAEIALGWIVAEFEAVASKIVADINALPVSERREQRDTTPEFRIEIGQSEDRF